MQNHERYIRRLASLFLGLFLSLLAMVSLHDFSHRADAVPAVIAAVALGVRRLGVRLVRLMRSVRRDAVQLRAPPALA